MRESEKTYEVRVPAGSKKQGNVLKKGIHERCDSDRNLFFAEKIGVNNAGLVTAVIQYRLPNGTATPTHIEKMVRAVARKVDVPLADVEVTRLAS